MSQDKENKTKVEIEVSDVGVIHINFFEYIKSLSDDQKRTLMDDGGWWAFISREIINSIVTAFSSENYNAEYHEIRTAILTSDAMPVMIRRWAEEMIRLRYYSKQCEEYWSSAYWQLYNWASKKDYEYRGDMPPLSDRKFGVEYPKELMDDVRQKVKEWAAEFPELENAEDYGIFDWS